MSAATTDRSQRAGDGRCRRVPGRSAPRRFAPRLTRRLRAQDGAVAGFEALAFGVLVFVFGTLIIVNGWAVVDAKFATNAAAREAVRSVVEADPGSDGWTLQTRAEGSASQAAAAHGHNNVTINTSPSPLSLARCAEITITASVQVEATVVPGIVTTPLYNVNSTHSEVVDPFRSGLEAADGVDACGF